jgi:hypothetical protein
MCALSGTALGCLRTAVCMRRPWLALEHVCAHVHCRNSCRNAVYPLSEVQILNFKRGLLRPTGHTTLSALSGAMFSGESLARKRSRHTRAHCAATSHYRGCTALQSCCFRNSNAGSSCGSGSNEMPRAGPAGRAAAEPSSCPHRVWVVCVSPSWFYKTTNTTIAAGAPRLLSAAELLRACEAVQNRVSGCWRCYFGARGGLSVAVGHWVIGSLWAVRYIRRGSAGV